VSRKWIDCPRCRLTAHQGPCKLCNNQGSVAACPPVGETVVVCFRREGEEERCHPMLVTKAVRRGTPARVYVSGLIFSFGVQSPVSRVDIEGPSTEPGHWRWKGSPS
jgi:hypothetical protein